MFLFSKYKKPASEWDFASTGRVSIWIGDFEDEMELLEYVEAEDGFGADFGCVLRDRRELVVKPQPITLRELLRDFSCYPSFIEEVVRAAGEDVRARCAVISYASDYRLLKIRPKSHARLHFLTVASFGDKNGE